MSSPSCSGIKEWKEYCKEYEVNMIRARESPSVVEQEGVGGGEEGGGTEGGKSGDTNG